jgi:hypothetical protein
MSRESFSVVAASVGCAVFLCGCATGPRPLLKQQIGESVVCIGDEPAALAWLPFRGRPMRVRSTYLESTVTVEYVEGRDFIVDYANGTLRRTPESRLPDFRTAGIGAASGQSAGGTPGPGAGGFRHE